MNAVVLLSGGVDSSVVLAHALSSGRNCVAISFDYGQKHHIELAYAKKIAAFYKIPHHCIQIDATIFSQSQSSLLCAKGDASFTKYIEPKVECEIPPATYVPARNLLFLSHGVCFAESTGAHEIYFGANLDDTRQYIDCRPSFFEAFSAVILAGSAKNVKIICPLQTMTKQEVFSYGKFLQVPFELTWSCYNPQNDAPCTVCQACILRNEYKE